MTEQGGTQTGEPAGEALFTDEVARQAVQQAVQKADEAAQQASQAVQAAQEAARAAGVESSVQVQETDTTPGQIGTAWKANVKRTYDEYQDLALNHARNAEDHANRMRTVSENAIVALQEHQADLRAQKIRHNDFSMDRQWNVDEVARLVVSNEVFLAAIKAAVSSSDQG